MDLAEGCPDAEVSIGHGESRECKPTVLEIAQEREPTLLALPLAALTGQDDLVAVGERPDDREQRALAVLNTRLYVEAVGLPVDDRQIRQVLLLPGLIVEFEPGVESLNRACRQRRAFAQ